MASSAMQVMPALFSRHAPAHLDSHRRPLWPVCSGQQGATVHLCSGVHGATMAEGCHRPGRRNVQPSGRPQEMCVSRYQGAGAPGPETPPQLAVARCRRTAGPRAPPAPPQALRQGCSTSRGGWVGRCSRAMHGACQQIQALWSEVRSTRHTAASRAPTCKCLLRRKGRYAVLHCNKMHMGWCACSVRKAMGVHRVPGGTYKVGRMSAVRGASCISVLLCSKHQLTHAVQQQAYCISSSRHLPQHLQLLKLNEVGWRQQVRPAATVRACGE